MSVRVVVLVSLVSLVILLCLAQPAESRKNPDKDLKTEDKLKLQKTKQVRQIIHRIGNNRCKVCTTTKYRCFYNVTATCIRYRNGTIITQNVKNETITSVDYDDDWNDDVKDGDVVDTDNQKQRGRKRRRRAVHKPMQKENWKQHHNNEKYQDLKILNKKKGNFTRTRCRKTLAKYCKETTCELQCCDGTLIDTETSACVLTTPLECKNGGTLDGRRTNCLCPTGYLGKECQHRKCSVKCQNGGACHTKISGNMSLEDTTYNDDHCVCPADTTGKFCESRVCNLKCENNGTCQGYRHWSECLCPPGFHGRRCEHEKKAGDCPVSADMANCRYDVYRHVCFQDSQCPGKKKCCRNACYHHVCSDPYIANATCTYKNTTYSAGTVFYPDDCRLCTCNGSHVGSPHAVIECTRIVCPGVPTHCKNVSTPEGGCCPICNDDPSVNFCRGNYKYPYFVNCPEDIVVFDVDENSKLATVKIQLHAKDCMGNALDVKLSDGRLQAGVGEENFRLLSATSARDAKGNFAECVFQARVRDPYPPVFLTCPIDFTEMQPGAVRWELPVARDNVGLAIPPTSRHHPGNHLKPGDYMVEYWTEDFQGNIARCSFVITVANQPQDDDDDDLPYGLDYGNAGQNSAPPHEGHSQGHSHLAIALCMSTVVLAIIIVGVVFVYRLKRLKQRSALRNQAASPQAQGAATVTAMGSVARGNNVGLPMGLPQYALSPDEVMCPPSYTPTDEMMACGGSPAPEAGELPSKKGPLP